MKSSSTSLFPSLGTAFNRFTRIAEAHAPSRLGQRQESAASYAPAPTRPVPSGAAAPTGVRLNTSRKDGFVFLTHPQSPAANSYRNLAAQILGLPRQRRVMLVTSPATGDGKTITSVNLALALAEQNLSVLLVELSLDRPRYRWVFGPPPSTRGVEAVLRGEASADDVTFQLADTGVAITGVATPPKNNHLLAERSRIEHILDYGQRNYDWVILDAPSMRHHQLVRPLANLAGAVVMVARSHRTPATTFRKATRLLGRDLDYVVLNETPS